MNDIIDVGSNHSGSDNIFESDLNSRADYMMDEYTQTQIQPQLILFDAESQTCEDSWEMKCFKLTRENEILKNQDHTD